jgi:hypothetical protein
MGRIKSDTNLFIIMNTTVCTKHAVEIGVPCWYISSPNGNHVAICGDRARIGGATALPTPIQYKKDISK